MYVFQKNLANDVTSWEYEKRRTEECKAKIKLYEPGIFWKELTITSIQKQSVE